MKGKIAVVVLAIVFFVLAATARAEENSSWNLTVSEQFASKYLVNYGRVINNEPGMVGTFALTSPSGWSIGVWHYYSFHGGNPFKNPNNETDFFVYKHWESGKWEIEPALPFRIMLLGRGET